MENPILSAIKKAFSGASDLEHRRVPTVQGDFTLTYIKEITNSHPMADHIISPLMQLDQKIKNLDDVKDHLLLPSAIEILTKAEEAYRKLLSGNIILTCDWDNRALSCEIANYATRKIPKPDTDPSIKGPQEGFTELLRDNLSLIRKRIQNEKLVIQPYTLGTSSHTPVAIVYLKDTAPQRLVDEVLEKVENLKTNYIMETNFIEEEFKNKFTFFDTVGNTEKPDIACSKIFEGRIVMMVEGSSSIAYLPYFFTENFVSPDDYYTNRNLVTGLRLFRYFSFAVSTLLPAFYLALTAYHHSLVPSIFLFKLAATRAGVPFPEIIEILLMVILLELSREAGRRLPKSIGTTLTLVSTLILGETALQAGMASGGTIVIVGVYAVTSLINPKLVGPVIVLNICNILISSIFGLHGFFIFFIMMIGHLASLQSCGYPFMYPLGTMRRINMKGRDFFIRSKLKDITYNSLKGKKEE